MWAATGWLFSRRVRAVCWACGAIGCGSVIVQRASRVVRGGLVLYTWKVYG